ncbi:MAG: flagellar basal body rod protein FlgB, partial [Thermogutta sp.]|uniref:flagellar basal body rod protein FlgB n=1 Tax=Thermogutta sp. TaxID=1962930 RepID=UPI0019BB254A
MWNGIFTGTSIPLLASVADFTEVRHTVLAGNLANLDTPGYQAMDLPVEDFRAHLRQALAEKNAVRFSSPGDRTYYLGAKPPNWSSEKRPFVRHDGNDVSVEEQVSEMVKNQMLHNTALTIMTSQ